MAIPNTPNLGLHRFDTDEQFINTQVNDNFTALDAAVAMQIVTSATRPTTGLFNGLRIQESDTGRYYRYLNNAWVQEPQTGLSGTSAAKPVSGDYVGQKYWDTTNSIFWEWNGAAWVPGLGPVTTFVPQFTNLTGHTVSKAEYQSVGEYVHVEVDLTLGASAPTGVVIMASPVTGASYPAGYIALGVASIRDTSAGQYISGYTQKLLDVAGALANVGFYFPASGTNTRDAPWDGSLPTIVASGDYFSCSYRYKRALA